MTNLEQDKLIDKIRKLLALADETKAGTPEEAASAAAKVQELLERYNLDMAQVKDAPKSAIGIQKFTLPTTRLWAKSLLSTLAGFNFCQALWHTGSTSAILVGEQVNIEAVLMLFEHLTGALAKMYTVYAAHYRGHASMQTFKTNFYSGAVNAIYYRLHKQQEKFVEENEGGRALVVVKKDEATKFMNEKFKGVSHQNTFKRTSVSSDGYQDGIKAGLIVEMNKLVK